MVLTEITIQQLNAVILSLQKQIEELRKKIEKMEKAK